MAEEQRVARLFGVLFIITFLTSISALALFQPVLDAPAVYIGGDGQDSQIYLGVLLEFLLILSNVGTTVVLYRSSGGRTSTSPSATSRLESSSASHCRRDHRRARVVGLRQDSPDAGDLAVSLAALKDWTFLLGPRLVVPFGNGLILGYLMYRSGLVPRGMAWLGLIGGATRPDREPRRALRCVGARAQ